MNTKNLREIAVCFIIAMVLVYIQSIEKLVMTITLTGVMYFMYRLIRE